ncbi:MAG: DNA starvation/stationary phase protection protein Dps [Verrucomicrobia bacterium]|nr:DNA starvation/stationary phase protection protein Dps [Verrucomicrobiota bacterium]
MKTLSDTKVNLSEQTRAQVTSILNQLLADLSDLCSQCKQAHWNVRGSLFYPLHKVFDDLAESIGGHLDPLAERITALGGVASGTVRQAAALSALPEFPHGPSEGLAYVTAMIDRFGLAANAVRKAIDDTAALGDAGTADLLTGVSQDLDKGLWFLEAHTRS